jgi:hypothetical protein
MDVHHADKQAYTLVAALIQDPEVHRNGLGAFISRDQKVLYQRPHAIRIRTVVKQTAIQTWDRIAAGRPAL